jgi:hypothetical protein
VINIEKKKFDREYATSYRSEVLFLRGKKVYYEFVKIIDGISIYKYRKTPELFKALESFYKQFEGKPQP